MPFPVSWPPETGTSKMSRRIYVGGTTTLDFQDNAFMFAELLGLSVPIAWPFQAIRVFNDGTADIEVTFDGTNIHGVVKPSRFSTWYDRTESGIAVRSPGPGVTGYRIEGW